MRSYYVYIATNNSETLYVGVTNDLERRMRQHASGSTPGFTAKYKVNKLLYFEEISDINDAITREKQIKNWRRAKKVWLINQLNPRWYNLMVRPLDYARGDREG